MQQSIPESPSQPQNIHGLTQWNNRAEFRVDVYPRQEGLLSFNSDYMVWYRRKTKMFVDPNNANTATLGEVAETLQYMVSLQGRNTWTIDDLVPYVEKLAIISQEQERITEHVAHGPASERRFPPQQFHMLQSSVETRGFDKRREIVQAEDFSQQMDQRGHGMYYTPPTFSQYPSQMYQYPFEGHDTDMSTNEHSFGGVLICVTSFLQRLSNKGRDSAQEEIRIVKPEGGIDHVAHPHAITNTIMTDFDVSI
ncbi:hypothetical protein GmHk_15G043908 [Glycine max]|nr:hypothetical protein GmHk_15G043908 [Glycine max]